MTEEITIYRVALEEEVAFYGCYSQNDPKGTYFEITREATLHINEDGEGRTYEFKNLEEMLHVLKKLVRGADAFIQSSEQKVKNDE